MIKKKMSSRCPLPHRSGGSSPVVIYRKCTQRTICLLYTGKDGLLKENSEPIRGGPRRLPPVEAAIVSPWTVLRLQYS